jgi:ribosomal protein S18 acetylase RimI-like enzyme
VIIRRGGIDDADMLLSLFDDAVQWLAERGQVGQWGSEPWSQQPERVNRIRAMSAENELLFAEIEGETAGALVLTEHAPEYVPRSEEDRELYVLVLVTARAFTGRGIGRRLLRHAFSTAQERGISLVRVDCWAGAEGRLVAYYRSAGFAPVQIFDYKGWPGQVLEHRVDAADGQR